MAIRGKRPDAGLFARAALGPIEPVGLPVGEAVRAVQLRKLADRVDELGQVMQWGGLEWDASEKSAHDYTERQAEKAEGILSQYGRTNAPDLWLSMLCAEMGDLNPATFAGFFACADTRVDLYNLLARHDLELTALGADDLEAAADIVLVDLQKACDPRWWLRQWRKAYARRLDEIARALGQVRKGMSPYCANVTVANWKRQQAATLEYLGGMEAVNDDPEQDALNLADIAKTSLSNPSIRRAELMTRLRGFEIYANARGYRAEFWTLTAPSRFHATTTIRRGRKKSHVRTNQKWIDADRPSVRDAQVYLCNVWGRIRAAADRAGCDLFGFRIAEPHADGCPHWHLLVFVPADDVSKFIKRDIKGAHRNRPESHGPVFVAGASARGAGTADSRPIQKRSGKPDVALGTVARIARLHAIRDSQFEPGAAVNRFIVEPIKQGTRPDTGEPYSAVGYVAKYIAKNLDGVFEKPGGSGAGKATAAVDYTGGGSIGDTAQRVRAWASCHGIRQFQQFGGPPVGVWRELRRLYNQPAAWKGDEAIASIFERTEQEDKAEAWAAYCAMHDNGELLAGLVQEIRQITRPTALEGVDLGTGEIERITEQAPARGRYGLPVVCVSGLALGGTVYQSRLERWTLRRKAPEPSNDSGPPEWRRLVPSGLAGRSQTGAPRTRGNNCTAPNNPTIRDTTDLNLWKLELAKLNRRGAAKQ
ncbi:MAG: replication endonuclease [Natronospirillum sp.]